MGEYFIDMEMSFAPGCLQRRNDAGGGLAVSVGDL